MQVQSESRPAAARAAPEREPPSGRPATAGPVPRVGAATVPAADALSAVLARVVAKRVAGGGALLQRMTLAQTGWLPDLEDIGDRMLVTDGRKVRLYFKEAPEASSKAAALASAAELNAAVGKTADDKAYATWSAEKGWQPRDRWNSNDKWTPATDALGDAALKSLDPFFLGVKVPFKKGSETHVLELTYQHSTSWTGYVESVYDSSNPATSDVPSMYDLTSEELLKGTKPAGEHWRNLLYSNKHDVHEGTNLLTTSGGGTDASFDAYTKIAGEGARWQCVRRHGQALQDDSMFFVSVGPAKHGVSFKTLWLSWKSVFGKAYDIPDADVAVAIRRGLMAHPRAAPTRGVFPKRNVKPVPAPAAKDYDLDTGRPGG